MALSLVGYLGLIAYILVAQSSQAGTDQPLKGAAPTPTTSQTNSLDSVDFVGYSDELDKRVYEGTQLGGLSGLAYDSRRNVYYAVVDREAWDAPARFYTLRLPFDDGRLGAPQILGVTVLHDPSGQPYTGENFDGEGIAITSGGELLVASETEPSIRRFSLDGRFLDRLPVPQKFRVAPQGQTRSNGSFESLSTSPDGRSLFTAPQHPLLVDGRSLEEAQRIRLVRYEKRGAAGFQPSEEYFYLTEPGRSLTDIFALSEKDLLVLEGRTIFRVSLEEAEDISEEKSLRTSQAVPVDKEFLVNLAYCPLPSTTNHRPAFFESLELGESLPGGRQALVVASDDNFDGNLKTRVVALSVRVRPSAPLTGMATCD